MVDVEVAEDTKDVIRRSGMGTVGGARAAVITWSKLTVTAQSAKGEPLNILKDVSGYLQPTQLLAIMGPSGSGKSILLDTLSGRLTPKVQLSGQILLNGHKSKLSYGVSAYVSHDEALVGTLSVREALRFVAQLRLPKSMPNKDKLDRAEEVLLEMGLKVCGDTKIGNWHTKGISGGQRRRVAIACELITHPTLLFLDEPTSGLDAAAAFHVTSAVKQLATQGRTILASMHQPSSEVFQLFDYLCLLSKGQVLFYGLVGEAEAVFKAAGLPCPHTRNPADHYIHCSNTDFQDSKDSSAAHSLNMVRLVDAYTSTHAPRVEERVTSLSAAGVAYEGSYNKAGWMAHTVTLTRRMLLNNFRDLGMYWVRVVMYACLGLGIGTNYLSLSNSWGDITNRAAMLYFTLCFFTFMAISGFPTFGEDMKVYKRERLNGYYGVSSFAVANTVAGAPFLLGIAVMCTVIIYWTAGLNDGGDRVVYFILNLYMCVMTVESMMMAIAAVVPHYLMGIAAGASFMGVFMLVGGFLKRVADLPAPVWRYPLHYLAYHSYSFSGFMRNEFDGTNGWACPCSIQPGGCPDTSCSLSGKEVLAAWSLPAQRSKWADIVVLVGMTAAYRVLFYVALKGAEKFGF